MAVDKFLDDGELDIGDLEDGTANINVASITSPNFLNDALVVTDAGGFITTTTVLPAGITVQSLSVEDLSVDNDIDMLAPSRINHAGVPTLSATTLGVNVVNSSLTRAGADLHLISTTGFSRLYNTTTNHTDLISVQAGPAFVCFGDVRSPAVAGHPDVCLYQNGSQALAISDGSIDIKRDVDLTTGISIEGKLNTSFPIRSRVQAGTAAGLILENEDPLFPAVNICRIQLYGDDHSIRMTTGAAERMRVNDGGVSVLTGALGIYATGHLQIGGNDMISSDGADVIMDAPFHTAAGIIGGHSFSETSWVPGTYMAIMGSVLPFEPAFPANGQIYSIQLRIPAASAGLMTLRVDRYDSTDTLQIQVISINIANGARYGSAVLTGFGTETFSAGDYLQFTVTAGTIAAGISITAHALFD